MLALNYFVFILVGIIIGLVVAIIIKKTNMGVTNYENLWNKFRNIYGRNYVIAAIPYNLESIDKIGKHKTVYDLMIEMKREKIINATIDLAGYGTKPTTPRPKPRPRPNKVTKIILKRK